MRCSTSPAILVFAVLFTFLSAGAQDVLPEFSVRELTKGKIQISWNNPYDNCIQLSIQRSVDSTKNFRTLFSTLSPELPSNGYVDNKPIYGTVVYYRIFYVLLGGAYYFSRSIGIETKMINPVGEIPVRKAGPGDIRTRSVRLGEASMQLVGIFLKKAEIFKLSQSEYFHFRDSINAYTKDGLHRINENNVEWLPAKSNVRKSTFSIYQKDRLVAELSEPGYKKFKDSIAANTRDTLFAVEPWRIQLHLFAPNMGEYMFIYRNDSLVAKLEMPMYKYFKDSIATRTRDTLYLINSHQLEIHPFTTKNAWRPSSYVYTNSKGFVCIVLPSIKQHRYRIVFYDDANAELFQLRPIKETEFVLDKTNFVHAGWFSFELFEDDKLKEKNRFFLTRD